MVQSKYLRTNYRLTGAKKDTGAWTSVIAHMRITIQHGSDVGDVVTFSMEGYGVPSWIVVQPASDLTFTYISLIRTSQSGSYFYMTVAGATGSMGSLAATTSYPWYITALIASR